MLLEEQRQVFDRHDEIHVGWLEAQVLRPEMLVDQQRIPLGEDLAQDVQERIERHSDQPVLVEERMAMPCGLRLVGVGGEDPLDRIAVDDEARVTGQPGELRPIPSVDDASGDRCVSEVVVDRVGVYAREGPAGIELVAEVLQRRARVLGDGEEQEASAVADEEEIRSPQPCCASAYGPATLSASPSGPG